MKTAVQPTGREKLMRPGDFIVSKTDLKGRITYGNRIFIEFSGYKESELLGKPHNIIRHPMMPRGVFKFLWQTIQARKECFAYVVNLSKDGSHYWVFANVTPDLDAAGHPCGYYSVRRAPKRAAVETLTDLYRQLQKEEQQAGPRDACEASLAMLSNILAERKVSYDEFVLAL